MFPWMAKELSEEEEGLKKGRKVTFGTIEMDGNFGGGPSPLNIQTVYQRYVLAAVVVV